ncbi:MAG: hypothetical protein LBL30_01345 [Holosporales bacterium]|jgi:hypothetical protein|nr:hypothetical protein [Holosporales bacterium]
MKTLYKGIIVISILLLTEKWGKICSASRQIAPATCSHKIGGVTIKTVSLSAPVMPLRTQRGAKRLPLPQNQMTELVPTLGELEVKELIDYSDYHIDHNYFMSCYDEGKAYQMREAGVLHYIFFKSRNMYNTAEVRLLATPGAHHDRNRTGNLADIFNHRTPTGINMNGSAEAKLMFSFVHIEIRPFAFMIATYPNIPHRPITKDFVFQASKGDGRWVTLSEQRSFNPPPPGAFTILFVDTDEYYHLFRICDTSTVATRNFGFRAFDIFGEVDLSRHPKFLEANRVLDDSFDAPFDPYSLPEFE